MERLQLAPPAANGFALPMRLTDGSYEVPLDQAVGPLHLTKVRLYYYV